MLLSVAPSVPNIVPVECRVDQNSVTISWKPSPESTNVDGYCLELADGVDSDFKVFIEIVIFFVFICRQ